MPVGEMTPVLVSPRLSLPDWTRRPATLARRTGALVSLAAIVYLGATIAIGTAAAPGRRVPARLGGFPAWLRGPLSGIGLPLSRTGFVVALVAMFAFYAVAVACA